MNRRTGRQNGMVSNDHVASAHGNVVEFVAEGWTIRQQVEMPCRIGARCCRVHRGRDNRAANSLSPFGFKRLKAAAGDRKCRGGEFEASLVSVGSGLSGTPPRRAWGMFEGALG